MCNALSDCAESGKDFGGTLRRFENAKSWEWGELLAWLEQLDASLTANLRLNDKQIRMLAKRLQQCLSPLFPEIVHIETLKVFHAALPCVQAADRNNLTLFLSALYSFFTYAKEDSQAEVLNLLSAFLFPYEDLTTSSMDSLLISMLMGLDRSGLSNHIVEELQGIRKRNERDFDSALWRSVMKTPSIRAPALELILSFYTFEESGMDQLAVNALATTLWTDENEDVLKLAMETIKEMYPITSQHLTVLHKRQLVSGMCFQLSKRREEMSKSIVEWLIPGLSDMDQLQNLVVPVLIDLFSLLENSEERSTQCIGILEAVLEIKRLKDLRLSIMQGFSFHFLTYVHGLYEYTVFGERIRIKAGILLNSLEDIAGAVWNSIAHLFLETFTAGDVQGLPVLLFALESYQVSKDSGEWMLKAAIEIIHRLSSLDKEELEQALSILRDIGKFSVDQELSLPWHMLEKCDVLLSQVLEHESSTAEIAINWFCYLHLSNPHANFPQSTLLLASYTASTRLSDIQLLVSFLTQASNSLEESVSKALGSALDFTVFRRLWQLETKTSGMLLITVACNRPNRFSEFLLTELSQPNPNNEVRRFTWIWTLVSCECESVLPILFESRPGLIRILALLGSPDYQLAQEAAFCLNGCLNHLEIIVNTLIGLLRSQEHCAEGLIYSANILRTDGESVVRTLTAMISPDQSLAKILLTAFLDLVEMYPNNGSTGLEVPVSACECLFLFLSHKIVDLAMFCFTRILILSIRCFEAKFDLILLELLKLLQLLCLKSGLQEYSNDLRSKIASAEFETVYLQPIPLSDELLWCNLTQFHIETFPLVLALVRPPHLITIVPRMIEYYLPMLPDAEEAFSALHVVIYTSMELLNLHNFVDVHGDLIASTYPDLLSQRLKKEQFYEDVTRSIAEDKVKSSTRYLFGEFIITLFLRLQSVIRRAAVIIPSSFNPLDLSFKGIQPYASSPNESVDPEDDPIKTRVKTLLLNLAKQHPNLFFSLCANLWHNNYTWVSPDQDMLFRQIIQILELVEFTPLQALKAATYYLRVGLEIRRSKISPDTDFGKENGLCHFLYSFLALAPDANFAQEKEKKCWKALLRLLDLLCIRPETDLWQLHFIHLGFSRMSRSSVNLAQLSQFQKHYTRLLRDEIIFVCSSDPTELRYPYPPAAYFEPTEHRTARLATFLTLIFTMNKAMDMFKDDLAKKVSLLESEGAQLVSSFLSATDSYAELAARLCLDMVTEAGNDLKLTPTLMDYFGSKEFREQLFREKRNQGMNKWSNYVRIFTDFSFPEQKVDLVNEVMKVSIGYFTSKANEIYARENALKLLCFFIYCSDFNSFESAFSLIIEKLIEHLRLHDGAYIPVCFLLTRILMCKMDDAIVNDFWPRVWPHIMMELMRILEDSKLALLHKLAGLKLLEFLYQIGNEDFRMHLWIFTYDCVAMTQVQRYQFVPMIPRVFQLMDEGTPRRTALMNSFTFDHGKDQFQSQVVETEEGLFTGAKDMCFQVISRVPVIEVRDLQSLYDAIELDIRKE